MNPLDEYLSQKSAQTPQGQPQEQGNPLDSFLASRKSGTASPTPTTNENPLDNYLAQKSGQPTSPTSLTQKISSLWDWSNTPLVSSETALGQAIGTMVMPGGMLGLPGAIAGGKFIPPKESGVVGEAAKGAGDVLAGLSSPLSLALTAGTFGVGPLLKLFGSSVESLPTVFKGAKYLMDAGFTAMQVKQLAQESHRFLDAWREGDYPRAARIGVNMLGAGAMAAAGGSQTLKDTGHLFNLDEKLGFSVKPTIENQRLRETVGLFYPIVDNANRNAAIFEKEMNKKFPKMKDDDYYAALHLIESDFNKDTLIEHNNNTADAAGKPEFKIAVPEKPPIDTQQFHPEVADILKDKEREQAREQLVARKQFIQQKYSNKETKLLFNSYKKALNPTPQLLELAKAMIDKDKEVGEYGNREDVLPELIEHHINHIWQKDADNPATNRLMHEVNSGQFHNNVSSALHRVFKNTYEGVLYGKKLAVINPIELVGNQIARVGEAVATRKALQALQDKFVRSSDGMPMTALAGTGQLSEGSSPSVLINPNSIRNIRIAEPIINGLKRIGELDRLIKEGKIVRVGKDLAEPIGEPSPIPMGPKTTTIRQDLEAKANLSGEHSDAIMALLKARADMHGVPLEDYIDKRIAGIEQGGEAGQGALFQKEQPWYYSQVRKSLESTSGQTFTPEQIKGYLKNQPGIKADELKWLGIDDFLSGKAKVTKDELLRHIDENAVRVQDVTKGQADDILRNPTKFDRPNLVLEGPKENYREVLLTLPTKNISREGYTLQDKGELKFGGDRFHIRDIEGNSIASSNTPEQAWRNFDDKQVETKGYRSSHWDEPNVLAHVRLDDRTDANGNKVLFVEEAQSDWHQTGKREGYTLEKKDQLFKEASQKASEARLALIPLLRKADDLGYDSTSAALVDIGTGNLSPEGIDETGVPGLIGAARRFVDARTEAVRLSSSSKAVPAAPFSGNWHELVMKRVLRLAAEEGYDKVAWTTGEQQAERYNLSKKINAVQYSKKTNELIAFDKDDNIVLKEIVPSDKVSGYIGKDVTQKLLNSNPKQHPTGEYYQIQGIELKVGGEWAKNLYDRMIPQFLDKYGKKWGAKVGDTNIGPTKPWYHIVDIKTGDILQGNFKTEESAYEHVSNYARAKVEPIASSLPTKVHSVDVTPSMRKSVVEMGQPLFQSKEGVPKGSVEFKADGRAVIRAFKNADVSTMVHELGHVFRRDLEGTDLKTIEDWTGVKNGEWKDDHEEKFARGFERYLRDGKSPTFELSQIFSKFKEWLSSIYRTLKGSPIAENIPDNVRKVYDKLLASDLPAPELPGGKKPIYMWDTHGYKTIDHHAFRNWKLVVHTPPTVENPKGIPIYAKTELRVHPEAYDFLSRFVGADKSSLRSNLPLRYALAGTSMAKHTILSLSPFHIAQIGLRTMMSGILPRIVDWKLEGDPILTKLVENTLTVTPRYGIKDWQGGVSEGLGTSGKSGLISKVPVVRDIQNHIQSFTFEKLLPSLKVLVAKDLYTRYTERFKDTNFFNKFVEEHEDFKGLDKDNAAARAAAKETNERLGGLNYRDIGRAAGSQDFLRLTTLAPDWLESELRLLKRLFDPTGGVMLRRDMVRLTAGMWVTARVLNYLISQKAHNEAPFGVVIKDNEGKDKVYSLRTLPTDIMHLASDPHGFMANRMSPLVRSGMEAIQMRDSQGRKLTPWQTTFDLVRNIAPIAAQTAGKAATGELPSDVGIGGQALKAAGLTTWTYKTEAQKKAAELASNRSESGPVDLPALRKHQAIQEFEDRLRSGEIKREDIFKLVENGQLPIDEGKTIVKTAEETREMDPELARLYTRTSRLGLPDVIQIWNLSTNEEKTALAPMLLKKKNQYLKKINKDMTPQERVNDPTYKWIRATFPSQPPW